MSDLTWTNIRVRLGELKPWADNPRMSSMKQAKRILTSFNDFGQVQPIAVSPSLDVYDGHQRLSALLTVHGKSYEVDARQSSRALADDERRAMVLALHAGAVGSFNWDVLSGWDEVLLKAGGLDEDFLKQLNTDAAAVSQLLLAAQGGPDWDAAMQSLPDEDRTPFQQMTFTLHDEQVAQVKEALKLAGKVDFVGSQNDNSNGNALAHVCAEFVRTHVDS